MTYSSLMTLSRPCLAGLGVLSALALVLSACGSSDSPTSSSSDEPTLPVGTADPTTVPTEVVTPAAPEPTSASPTPEGEDEEDQDGPVEPQAPAELEAVSMGQAVQTTQAVLSVGAPRVSDLVSLPGERGGEGLIIPVTVANSSAEDLSLEGLVVSVSWGADRTPAPQVTGSSDEVPASVAPGQAVVIEFAFLVPSEGRSDLRVNVGLGNESAAAVFTGSS